MQDAPAASYSFAISRYGKSSAMIPFDGDAFFTSQIKEISGFFNASANKNGVLAFAASSASRRTVSGDLYFFSSAIRSTVFSAIVSNILI